MKLPIRRSNECPNCHQFKLVRQGWTAIHPTIILFIAGSLFSIFPVTMIIGIPMLIFSLFGAIGVVVLNDRICTNCKKVVK